MEKDLKRIAKEVLLEEHIHSDGSIEHAMVIAMKRAIEYYKYSEGVRFTQTPALFRKPMPPKSTIKKEDK